MIENQLGVLEQKTQQDITLQSHDQEKVKVKFVPRLDIDPDRSRYGKMIILLERPFLISIGPDYLCFLGGFSFFVCLAYFLCWTVSSSFQNQNLILFTYAVSLAQCGSYLLVALSNPHVSLRQKSRIKQITQQNIHRVCKKCGAQTQRRTYHCRDCDVCIKGYDHHCPWTSKCIGEGNLYHFYAFVTITPIYILIFMGLMMGCLIISAQNANQNLQKHSL